MTFKELESIIHRAGGTCYFGQFDCGYAIYGSVDGVRFHESMEYGDETARSFVNPVDRVYSMLIIAGAISEDDSSIDHEGTYTE